MIWISLILFVFAIVNAIVGLVLIKEIMNPPEPPVPLYFYELEKVK